MTKTLQWGLGMGDMTLDEAIEHCKQIADKESKCECAMEHRQLAQWLEQLKRQQREIMNIEALSDARWKMNRRLSMELAKLSWHYPGNGEYPNVGLFCPTMSDLCVVAVNSDGINKHIDTAYYDFRENGWVKFPFPGREEWLKVYAWKEAELPEEIKKMNEPRMGQWEDLGALPDYPHSGINCYHSYRCIFCGCLHRVKVCDDGRALNANFCPNCGQDMREEK